MKKTRRNYIPFIAGMATMILLACLISASLAREEAPETQSRPQVQVQAGDLRLAPGEAGIALFGVERVAPGGTAAAENGAEVPAVLTLTDGRGEPRYYVEARTIADILDVCHGATYRESINCVDFGAAPWLDENGEVQTKAHTGEPIWFVGDVKCDIKYYKSRQEDGGVVGIAEPNGADTLPPPTKEERAQREKEAEEWRQNTPLKPEYGITRGMYTEVDPAEVNMASWSGTAMKGQKFRGEKGEAIEHSFAFTPYLGEYAVITIENTGARDALLNLRRPNTVGNRGGEVFGGNVRVPAGQTLVRAFRINGELPLENQLDLSAVDFGDEDIELSLTAEQYRFGK